MDLDKKQISRALRPDAQAFDEIRLITTPRYKMSELSGDEWRINITAQYYRKGVLKFHENIASDMEHAVALLAYKYMVAADAHAYYAGEGDFCDQEGCSEKAIITYKLKKEFCNSGHEDEPVFLSIRRFCDKHKTRGDCGLEDADRNYELLPQIGLDTN